ncbi:hypothetical protein BBO99_00002123 [Phytophthora kernoviae]|uniref:Apple domain-containing protein n=1 Tax=Phytophthora kernoviae TaxID=325452 RepID=A0A3R7G004_9STRA|nr:hypothetical protein JM16_003934 [Phytophthora kernoviae]RLN14757.1 hypothetical protein BBI17_002029 [Phytophthora kernoviae]RLN83452.1 hypothetical protein BBO99_00002123 [Phytophthora kernoviae]
MLAHIIIAFASLTAIAAGDCTTAPFGNCGSDSAGVSCCPTSQYCQPWDAGYYQCIDLPAQCTQQYPGVDFNGNDLQTVYGLQPGECCTKCTQTSGCKAYTFLANSHADSNGDIGTDYGANSDAHILIADLLDPNLRILRTTGCKAYTYINNNPGQPVCYLKSAVGTASTKIGAVSGTLN